jgi:glycosyltransferase involved in cell wall biosynthesis
LRSIRSPIVHFHSGNSCLPRSVMMALEVLRYRPSFVTVHSPYENLSVGSARARVWATMARRRLEAVISPSDHGTNYQLRLGVPARLVTTVANCVDTDAIAHGDASAARDRLRVGADDPLVVFCSRIDRQKRPVEAVRIFAGIAQDFPAAVLVFVGQGDEERAVRSEATQLGISDRVRLVGYQTNVPSWLAAATVWLLPTERENFSIAVLEALAAGCPILSTACQGNDEVLVNGDNALTFPVGDVAAGTEALRMLLRDPTLRARLRDRARASAQRYSVNEMVEGYRRVYGRSRCTPDRIGA